MDVYLEQCPACGGQTMQNILVTESEMPATVYVRCAACNQLVARYQLSQYYQHGKSIETLLQSLGAGADESGRDVLQEFSQLEENVQQGYQQALERLDEPPSGGKAGDA